MANPADTHWASLKRVLRYLKGTSSLGIKFPVDGTKHPRQLYGYTDSDYANDPEDRKSITGYILYYNDSPIAWSSTKQPCITLSSTEAELVAASAATQELIWLRSILVDFVDTPVPALQLYVDNQGAVELATNNRRIGSKSKHIDMKHFYIREQVQAGTIDILPISTSANVADVFTKGLPKPRFSECVVSLGLDPT
jgi:hypothetical protein